MGSPLGPLMANAFMCNIEEQLETENKVPAFYKRYVDDTLSAMPDVETASDFLTTLNNTHPSIDFTMELEVNGRLPFLGMDIIRNECRLDTKVYRKPTDTGLLLHYHSHVDGRYKRSLLNTMLNCAWELFNQECERLKVIFSRLRYPDKLVQSTIRQFVASKVSEESQTQQQVPDNNEAQSESCCLLRTRNLQIQYADNLQTSVGRSMQLSALCHKSKD